MIHTFEDDSDKFNIIGYDGEKGAQYNGPQLVEMLNDAQEKIEKLEAEIGHLEGSRSEAAQMSNASTGLALDLLRQKGATIAELEAQIKTKDAERWALKDRIVDAMIGPAPSGIVGAAACGAASGAAQRQQAANDNTSAAVGGAVHFDRNLSPGIAGMLFNPSDFVVPTPAPVPPSPEARLVVVYRELLELAGHPNVFSYVGNVDGACRLAADTLAPVVAPMLAKKAA